MIFRLLLLLISTNLHLQFYDAFYTQNFYDGMYPAEADSIGIPILTSMIVIIGAAIVSSPFVLLGSKFIRTKLSAARMYIAIPAVFIFLCCYALIILIASSGASSIFEVRYRAIAVDATWLFIVPLAFLVIDVVRLIRFLKNKKAQPTHEATSY
jgi:hypothetical protein